VGSPAASASSPPQAPLCQRQAATACSACAEAAPRSTTAGLTFSPRSMNCGGGTHKPLSPPQDAWERRQRGRAAPQRLALQGNKYEQGTAQGCTFMATCCPELLSKASSTKPNVPLLRSRICAGPWTPLLTVCMGPGHLSAPGRLPAERQAGPAVRPAPFGTWGDLRASPYGLTALGSCCSCSPPAPSHCLGLPPGARGAAWQPPPHAAPVRPQAAPPRALRRSEARAPPAALATQPLQDAGARAFQGQLWTPLSLGRLRTLGPSHRECTSLVFLVGLALGNPPRLPRRCFVPAKSHILAMLMHACFLLSVRCAGVHSSRTSNSQQGRPLPPRLCTVSATAVTGLPQPLPHERLRRCGCMQPHPASTTEHAARS